MENKLSKTKGNNENPPPTDETQNLNLMEVVPAEPTANDNERSGGNHPPPPPPPPHPHPPIVVGEGQSGAVAISADGGAAVVGNVGYGVGDVRAAKKKRDSAPRDPPPGVPTCPVCQRTFANWKGAFGHMRKHPEREYRGFFKPPTFSSSSSKPNDGDQGSSGVEGGSASSAAPTPATNTVRGNNVQFDLNQTPSEELAAVAASEVNKVGFDLNEFPQTDHDHEQHQE